MDVWDTLFLVGMVGLAAEVATAAVTVLRWLPWRKDWYVGGYD